MITISGSEGEDSGKQSLTSTGGGVVPNGHASRSYSRSLSHISENSADGVVLTERSACDSGEVTSVTSGVSINDIEMEMPDRVPDLPGAVAMEAKVSPGKVAVVEETAVADVSDRHRERGEGDQEVNQSSTSSTSRTESVDANTQSQTSIESSIDVTYVAHRVSVEDEETSGEGERLVDSGVEDALGAVISSLDDYRGQFPELQLLEQELRLLQVSLKVRWKSKGFWHMGLICVFNQVSPVTGPRWRFI